MPIEAISYQTQDSVRLRVGDRAYDIPAMKPGFIEWNAGNGTFRFRHSDGTAALLDGKQIVTLATAAIYLYPGSLAALAAA